MSFESHIKVLENAKQKSQKKKFCAAGH